MGIKAELFVDSNNTLILPIISTGHSGIDTMIRNAWLGHYELYGTDAGRCRIAPGQYKKGQWRAY